MWQYHVTKNKKGLHVMLAHCGTVEIRAVGSALDEVWEFASAIERAADELIIPLIGAERAHPVLIVYQLTFTDLNIK
jgi:hypothetical protein